MLIKVKNVNLKSGNTVLAENINFEMMKGSVFCIYGLNGSGKTMFLKVLLGLLPPQRGDVYYSIDKHKVGACLQFPEHLIYHSSVEEEIKSISNCESITSSVLRLLKLCDRSKSSPLLLSEGQKRLMFLYSLLASKVMLIFDEPFTSLDSESKKLIAEEIIKCKNKGGAVLYTTNRKCDTNVADKVITL